MGLRRVFIMLLAVINKKVDVIVVISFEVDWVVAIVDVDTGCFIE